MKKLNSEIGEEEQYLVQYASPHLHDLESLQRIADPTISDTIPSHTLSGLADVILLCIQVIFFYKANSVFVGRALKIFYQTWVYKYSNFLEASNCNIVGKDFQISKRKLSSVRIKLFKVSK